MRTLLSEVTDVGLLPKYLFRQQSQYRIRSLFCILMAPWIGHASYDINRQQRRQRKYLPSSKQERARHDTEENLKR